MLQAEWRFQHCRPSAGKRGRRTTRAPGTKGRLGLARGLAPNSSPAHSLAREPSAHIEMGAGIAASPHLRRAKDLPVFVSLTDPKVFPLLDPGSPAQASLPKVDPNPKTGSSSSAALLGPFPFRADCPPRRTAYRARKNGSSGASSGWSELRPKSLLIACRWRSDLPSLPTLFRRCRPSGGGWDFRPDHPFLMTLDPSRAKRKKQILACG